MQDADPLHVGNVLADRYRIGELLGSGGMSSVHRAEDQLLGREVAVKVIERTAADRAEMRRIRAEIDLLATLNHRALVTLFDAGHAVLSGRSVTYLVMELVDGPTLGQRSAAGRMPRTEVARMAQDLAEALVVVHAQGVVHRDIKPANILLAPSLVPGREFDVKLADFGIASLVDGARVTATGTVMGTAAYLSPEQATGTRAGPAADIYSLGLVLLETLTGRREFPGTMLESLGARLARDPVIPGELGYEWKSLLTAMTARDPEARPTATAVLGRVVSWSGAPSFDAGATGAIVPLDAGATGGVAAMTAAATTAMPEQAAPISPAGALDDDTTAVHSVAGGRAPRRRLPTAALLVGGAALAVAVPVVALQWGPAPAAPPADTAAAEPSPKAPTTPVAVAPEVEATPAPVEPAAPAPAPVTVSEPSPAEGGAGNGSGSGSNSGNGSSPGSNSGNGGSGGSDSGGGGGNGNGP